jgi:hypothetical protein
MFGWRLPLLAVAILFALPGCSTTAPQNNKGAGEVCGSNSECATGNCLGLAVFPGDGGCSIAGMSCSTTCSSDGDCASLGANFKCFEGCNGGPKTCGAT